MGDGPAMPVPAFAGDAVIGWLGTPVPNGHIFRSAQTARYLENYDQGCEWTWKFQLRNRREYGYPCLNGASVLRLM
jgi:hypothetical protein